MFTQRNASPYTQHFVPPSFPGGTLLKTHLWSLRFGFFFQLLSLLTLYGAYFISGGEGLFSWSLEDLKDDVLQKPFFRSFLVIGALLYLVGTALISSFQILLSDDAAWVLGFRAGSKMLSYATLYGFCADVLQFVLYLHLAVHYSPVVFAQWTGGGSEWLLFTFTRVLRAIAAIQYGQGLFLIEVYHDKGTSAFLGVALLVAYVSTGVLDLLSIAQLSPILSTAIRTITLSLAFVWALSFEQTVHAYAPPLHQTELANTLEEKVNFFARTPATQLETPENALSDSDIL